MTTVFKNQFNHVSTGLSSDMLTFNRTRAKLSLDRANSWKRTAGKKRTDERLHSVNSDNTIRYGNYRDVYLIGAANKKSNLWQLFKHDTLLTCAQVQTRNLEVPLSRGNRELYLQWPVIIHVICGVSLFRTINAKCSDTPASSFYLF